MRKYLLLIAFSLMLLSSCASLRPVNKLPEAETDTNNITILRNNEFYGSAIHFWPTVDNEDIAGLLVKQHVSFILPNGKHFIGVRCFGGEWPLWRTWKHEQLEVEVSSNERRYFLVTASYFNCAGIKEIQESVAHNFLPGSIRIPTGDISSCQRIGVPYTDAHDASCFPF
ncbi:MAG: hypothetical protein ABIS30_05675 [Gallionella sp.]|jgi:hypothetical protein